MKCKKKKKKKKKKKNFEPEPYIVVEKKGNAVLIEDQEGNTKLCNASHMKKFLQPDPCTEATETDGGDEAEDMPTGKQSEATSLFVQKLLLPWYPTSRICQYMLGPTRGLILSKTQG